MLCVDVVDFVVCVCDCDVLSCVLNVLSILIVCDCDVCAVMCGMLITILCVLFVCGHLNGVFVCMYMLSYCVVILWLVVVVVVWLVV